MNHQLELRGRRLHGLDRLDGTTKPSVNHYSWDAVTLEGTVDSEYDQARDGEAPAPFHDTFTIVTPPLSANS
jgi:hypothetical protein